MEVAKKMSNNTTFKEYVQPILVLVAICLVISFALAQTYGMTKPVIERITKENADIARAVVLPTGADGFTEYEGEKIAGVTEYYVANNKSGVAVTAESKSFGGTMTVMVGVDQDGKVTGVTVTNHADTPGLGTKAMTVEYLSQYMGVESLSEEKIKNATEVDAITGATISSDGVYACVRLALEQFNALGGVVE